MKKLSHLEITRIMADYIQALKMAKGERAVDMTELTYSKGFFYLRRPGLSPQAMPTPYRPREIEDMTVELRKLIPPRADSDEDYAD